MFSYDDIGYLYQIIDYIFVEFLKEFSILSLIDGPSKLCVKVAFLLFSKFINFNGLTSKRHISGYNHRRNPKLGSTELYGNTV